jgi:hypothetical protein
MIIDYQQLSRLKNTAVRRGVFGVQFSVFSFWRTGVPLKTHHYLDTGFGHAHNPSNNLKDCA